MNRKLGKTRVLWVGGALVLCLGLAACGGTRYLPSAASSDEETGSVVPPPPADSAGPESALGSATAGVAKAASWRPKASTRGGQGRLVRVKVRPGDSLWTLARSKAVYGSGWLYPLLYKANRALIPDPNRLSAGIVLKIPRDVPDPEVEKAEEEAMTGQYLDRSPLPRVRTFETASRAAESNASGSALAEAGAFAVAPAPASVPGPTPAPTPVPTSAGADDAGVPKFASTGWTLVFLLMVALGVWIFLRLAKDDSENGG